MFIFYWQFINKLAWWPIQKCDKKYCLSYFFSYGINGVSLLFIILKIFPFCFATDICTCHKSIFYVVDLIHYSHDSWYDGRFFTIIMFPFYKLFLHPNLLYKYLKKHLYHFGIMVSLLLSVLNLYRRSLSKIILSTRLISIR